MSGKRTIVMTGGTSGIGKEAINRLSLGNRVIMGARNTKRGEEIAKYLVENGRDVTYVPLDLSKPESIKSFADKVLELVGDNGIDVLLLNAGAYFHRKKTFESLLNVEQTLMTNHFGGHLLFELLKGALAQRTKLNTTGSKSRVVAVSSLGHTDDPKKSFWHPPVGKFDFERSWDEESRAFKSIMLSGQKKYQNQRAYCDSKLCNALFAKKIDREYEFIDAVFINPGFVPGTEIALLKSNVLNRVLKHIIPLMGLSNTVPQAANVLVESCLRENIKPGEYYTTNPDVKNPERFGIGGHNPEADDIAKQDKLYEIGETMVRECTNWEIPEVA